MREFMRSLRYRTYTLLIAGMAFAGCQGAKGPPPAMPPPQVTVSRPVELPVQHYLEYNGFLDPVESVQIKARVKGFLEEVKFKEGDEVKAGDLLYRIDQREYKAAVAKSKADIERYKADMANARAQIRLAEAELERMNLASNARVAAKSDKDKAEAQLAANQAQLETATANLSAGQASLQMAELDLEYTTIKAFIDGRISRTLVTKGNIVGQNELTLLTTIVRMDELFVYFDVPERDLIEAQRSLRETKGASPAVVQIEVSVATEEGFPHHGHLDFRENRVETGTGTIRLRGRIPNPHVAGNERLLYPGLYARVRIPIGEKKPQPVIPEDALMTGQEGRFVYVIGADNKVEKRTVTVGPQVWSPPLPGSAPKPGWALVNPKPPGEAPPMGLPVPPLIAVQSMVAIENGLKPGEIIIVNGLQKARPGAPVAPDEWPLRPTK